MWIKEISIRKFFFPTFIILFLGIINFNLIVDDPIQNYDDNLLIPPLEQLNSLNEYIQKMKKGEIFDVQPLRDLSLFLNIKAKQLIGHGFFHLTNFIIYLLILLFTFKFLDKSSPYAFGLILLLAVHPVPLSSVFWISARKHLLSAFFILTATYLSTKKTDNKHPWSIPVLYTCAVLSHPINVLWPIWFTVLILIKKESLRRKELILPIVLILLLTVFAYINYRYYTSTYLISSNGISKLLPMALDEFMGTTILRFSRSFSQIFFPLSIAPIYYIGNWKALLGIPLLVILPWFLWKSLNRKQWIWPFFIILPLLVVYSRNTNIFISDTYLLIPFVGIIITTDLILRKYRPSLKKFNVVITTFFCFFAFKSFHYAKAWESHFKLWEYSYRTEKSPHTLFEYGLNQYASKNFKELRVIAVQLKFWDPHKRYVQGFFAGSIYHDPYMELEEKLEILNTNYVNTPLFNHFLGSLYMKKDDWNKAWQFEWKGLVSFLENHFYHKIYKSDLSTILAKLRYLCFRIKDDTCFLKIDQMMNKIPKKLIDKDLYEDIISRYFIVPKLLEK